MISSLLREFIMADATDSERVVFILCEWTAGTWVYFSIDRFLAGKTLTGILLAALAIFFAVAGVKWPAVKLKLGAKVFQIHVQPRTDCYRLPLSYKRHHNLDRCDCVHVLILLAFYSE